MNLRKLIGGLASLNPGLVVAGNSRNGHFSLFVRYYMLVVLTFVCVFFGIAIVWVHSNQSQDAEYIERQMQGTHRLLEKRYQATPHSGWPALSEELASWFDYPVQLLVMNSLRDDLAADDWHRLERGEVVSDSWQEHTYQRLSGSNRVVALGRFDDVVVQGERYESRLIMEVMSLLAILCIVIALPLYFVFYRFWRDLRSLRNTADALTTGELDARAPKCFTRLVDPLGGALNKMAGQVQQALESQRILAQAVAHEIRTPLARMHFGLEMLTAASEEGERAHLFDGLEADIQRLEHLAARSMIYARFDRVPGLDREQIEVASLFVDLADLFKPDPPMKLCFASSVVMVSGNREALEIVLHNLIANALRHACGRVLVIIAEEGQRYVFRVEDDGEGVPEAERQRVFQPYTQLRKYADGFGLGLALVRVIAQKHGGRAAVEDSLLGGACFRIELPID